MCSCVWFRLVVGYMYARLWVQYPIHPDLCLSAGLGLTAPHRNARIVLGYLSGRALKSGRRRLIHIGNAHSPRELIHHRTDLFPLPVCVCVFVCVFL